MKVYKTITLEKDKKKRNRLTLANVSSGSMPASKKESFDFFIKKSFLDGKLYLPSMSGCNEENFGFYIDRYRIIYDRYFSNDFNIESRLSRKIQEAYNDGKGNEFKTGKFYSVASSSRFAVSCFSENINDKIQLLKDMKINGSMKPVHIKLEEKLTVFGNGNSVISHPQMDVVIDSDDKFFIEVKCHEILDNHKYIKLKWRYKDAKDFSKLPMRTHDLEEKTECRKHGAEKYLAIGGEFLTPKDFCCDLKTFHFDFKQFLCHLLGILNECPSSKKKHFYYVFYKNEEFIKNEDCDIYKELECELKTVFSVFGEKFPEIEFGYCYNDSFNTIENLRNLFQ